jgi:hypothetical protein
MPFFANSRSSLSAADERVKRNSHRESKESARLREANEAKLIDDESSQLQVTKKPAAVH